MDQSQRSQSVLNLQSERAVYLHDTRSDRYDDKIYNFEKIYAKEDTRTIFEAEIGARALSPLFDGRHCTVFAHGSTGSGKTFTMQGNLDSVIHNSGGVNLQQGVPDLESDDPNSKGLIPLSVESLL